MIDHEMKSDKILEDGAYYMSDDKGRRMRIAMYISSMNRGGAEHVMANLISYFVGKGYEMILVTTHKEQNEYALCGCEKDDYSANESKDKNGISSVRIHEPESKTDGSLIRYYSEIDDPENGSRAGNFRDRCRRLEDIWWITSPDVILSFIGKNNMMAVKTAQRFHIPVAVSVRADPELEYLGIAMRMAAKHYYRKAALVIMQTEETLGFFGVNIGKKAVMLRNPVEPEFLNCDTGDKRDKVILAVGRCDENKRHSMMIDAFAAVADKIPGYRLVIYGEGELRERLKKKVESLGMDEKISLPGVSDDIAGEMRRASVFILASDSEGMPNSLIEAMCMGMTCISTDCPCGGPRMLIKDKVNGFLIRVGCEKELEKAISAAAADADGDRCVAHAAQRIREIYSSEKVYGEWEYQLKRIAKT